MLHTGILSGFCGLPVVGKVCGAVKGAAGAVASGLLQPLVDAFVHAAQHLLALLMTFWTKVTIPGFDNELGPVGEIRHMTAWVTGAIATGCFIWTCGRLALSRNSAPAADIAKGLFTLLLTTALAVPLVNLLASFGDGFSGWVIDQAASTNDHSTAVGAGLAALEAGLAIPLGFFMVITSIVQIMLLIVRVGIVAILCGVLPMFAATSFTRHGEHMFRKVCGWLIAALAYGPAAALLYAGTFSLINSGQDVISVISGFAMMLLAIAALPALMRLVAPLTSPAVMEGGGGMAGVAGTAATGARMVGSRSSGGSSKPAPASASTGAPSGGSTASTASAKSNGGPSVEQHSAGIKSALGGSSGAPSGASGITATPSTARIVGAQGASSGAAAGGAAAAAPPALAVYGAAKSAQLIKDQIKGAADNGGNPSNGGGA